MARTVNQQARAVRREEFVAVAQTLIQAKGYEQMSIQDVLDGLDASRGAFYHYFESKIDLLDAVVDHLVAAGTQAISPIVADAGLSAPRKLEGLFSHVAAWKAERRDLMLALLRVWYSDDNALVRDKVRRSSVVHMAPLLTEIIQQGNVELTFSTGTPETAARLVLSLLLGVQDLAGELFFQRQAGAIGFQEVVATYQAYVQALERILGARAGSLHLIDEPALQLWFG